MLKIYDNTNSYTIRKDGVLLAVVNKSCSDAWRIVMVYVRTYAKNANWQIVVNPYI